MTNYSFETSYPPFKEKPAFKRTQCDEVLAIIKKGANNLLQLSEVSGITQAIISARVNDLIDEHKIKYEGFTYYRERKRKKICLITAPVKGVQKELNFFATISNKEQ